MKEKEETEVMLLAVLSRNDINRKQKDVFLSLNWTTMPLHSYKLQI